MKIFHINVLSTRVLLRFIVLKGALSHILENILGLTIESHLKRHTHCKVRILNYVFFPGFVTFIEHFVKHNYMINGLIYK